MLSISKALQLELAQFLRISTVMFFRSLPRLCYLTFISTLSFCSPSVLSMPSELFLFHIQHSDTDSPKPPKSRARPTDLWQKSVPNLNDFKARSQLRTSNPQAPNGLRCRRGLIWRIGLFWRMGGTLPWHRGTDFWKRQDPSRSIEIHRAFQDLSRLVETCGAMSHESLRSRLVVAALEEEVKTWSGGILHFENSISEVFQDGLYGLYGLHGFWMLRILAKIYLIFSYYILFISLHILFQWCLLHSWA